MSFFIFSERGEEFHGSSLWAPFQDTANLVTILYKGTIHFMISSVKKYGDVDFYNPQMQYSVQMPFFYGFNKS